MQQVMNTLFLTTPGTYVKREDNYLCIHVDGEKRMEIPLIHLNGIVCFGNILISPGIITRFAEENRPIVWHDSIGRFKGRLVGPTSGNVLLRKSQVEAVNTMELKLNIARAVVSGKIRNCRAVLQRGARDAVSDDDHDLMKKSVRQLKHAINRISTERYNLKRGLEFLRGIEGNAAREYFSAFDRLIRVDRDKFRFNKRTRRPPRDKINSLLSFLYTILLNDCVSALESVGLDPQFGFLHEIRPGRPSLALDLMEEFRAPIADRLALNLINRQQLVADDFIQRPGNTFHLSEKGRKTVLVAYQEKKQVTRHHPIIDQQVPIGLFPFVQSRLLARLLRGEICNYIPSYFK